MHWYCIYYCRIVSFIFGVFPCHSVFSAVTQFGLMEPTIEMQLSGYHECWVVLYHHNGSSRERLYLQQVLMHGKMSIVMAIDFVIHCYSHRAYHISDVFSTSGDHRILGGTLFNKSPFLQAVTIE